MSKFKIVNRNRVAPLYENNYPNTYYLTGHDFQTHYQPHFSTLPYRNRLNGHNSSTMQFNNSSTMQQSTEKITIDNYRNSNTNLNNPNNNLNPNHLKSQNPVTKPCQRWRVWQGRNKFYCSGRIIMSHENKYFLVTIFLITSAAVLFWSFDCRLTLWNLPGGYMIIVIG